jgi:hypothetical protein
MDVVIFVILAGMPRICLLVTSLLVLLASARTASADARHEVVVRYRNLGQPTLLYDDAFEASDGKQAWYRTDVFGLRISEYGAGPLGAATRILWAILFANQVDTNAATGKPVYATTDIGVNTGNHLSVDFGTSYMQFRVETELSRFFGFRIGWWLMRELDQRPIGDLEADSPTATFLRDHDAVKAGGKAGGEILMILGVPVYANPIMGAKVGMELNPFSFLAFLESETSLKLMRWMGYPRTFARVEAAAGSVTLRATALIPNRYMLVPWYGAGAELQLEAGFQF